MTTADALRRRHPVLAPLLEGADHVDVKQVEGELGLREFAAGMLAYEPAWLRALYGVRWLFVRVLGMRQEGLAPSMKLTAERVSMRPGDRAGFFTVTMGEEDRYWVVEATESHLTAYLGVVAEPLPAGRRRFHVLTIVRYHRWTGPVYFNVIRPFHHLVVRQMMKAGVRARGGSAARGQAAAPPARAALARVQKR
jgi:hypothetical protein